MSVRAARKALKSLEPKDTVNEDATVMNTWNITNPRQTWETRPPIVFRGVPGAEV